MKNLTTHLRQLTAAFSLSLIVTTGIHAEEQKNLQLDEPSLSNLHLEYGKVITRRVSASTPVTGAIQLDTTRVHDVVPRISGIISKDYRALGDVVKTGDPLVQLESQQYALALIKYFEAEHEMEHSVKSYSREKSLVEKKVSSPELLLKAEHDYRIAQITHTASLQLLKLLHLPESELHRLLNQVDHADLTKHLITAPADGVIIKKEVRLGSDVKPDQMLLTIADLSQLWVDIKVPIREAGSLKLGSLVKISTAIDQRSATAKVIYVAAVADALTRTILVRAVLNNKKGAWRPGTAVSVQINDSLAKQSGSSLAVPQNAVFDIEGSKAVFVKEGKGKFRLTAIRAGANDGEFTQILSGLTADQSVVTRNVVQLKAHFMMLGEE
ncbi:MAG: efflux RND transporter periplasmic adaptor subunit [Verrucomicrobiales bacterium]|nr:efflux RND transporter periplasmic adaptor subunit [Verrucomicrobiales bacterium]